MAAITVTAANVRPSNLTQCQIRRYRAGATLTPGQFVYIASDGDVEPADADADASSQAIGMVIADQYGSVSFAAGTMVDVVIEGPVEWGAGMTPGGLVYVSTTAGAGDQTAPSASGDFPFVVGRAEAAARIYVAPQRHPATVIA